MKLALKELHDKPSITRTYDYHDAIENVSDIIDIKPAHVNADIAFLNDQLTMDVKLDVELTLACAKTLKPVVYHMKANEKIVFGNDEDADFILEDPLPFQDIIFGYILSEKPLVVYHPDAQKLEFKRKKSPHPAFADLEQFLKK
eukprot:Anaeramoba_ignava/c19853_g1_i1.p3 GENE.c19853_g1_i1~~c19853_g1_i1.p3  ORF type:complete len:144 (+),score=17.91 c19853_g1_i1:2853-3284(+)